MACLKMENPEHEDTLENLESDLMDLRGVLDLLYDYFKYDKDYVRENLCSVALMYSQYGCLSSVCINEVDRMISRVRRQICPEREEFIK